MRAVRLAIEAGAEPIGPSTHEVRTLAVQPVPTVLKVFRPGHRDQGRCEWLALRRLEDERHRRVPRPLWSDLDHPLPAVAMTRLPGDPLPDGPWTHEQLAELRPCSPASSRSRQAASCLGPTTLRRRRPGPCGCAGRPGSSLSGRIASAMRSAPPTAGSPASKGMDPPSQAPTFSAGRTTTGPTSSGIGVGSRTSTSRTPAARSAPSSWRSWSSTSRAGQRLMTPGRPSSVSSPWTRRSGTGI